VSVSGNSNIDIISGFLNAWSLIGPLVGVVVGVYLGSVLSKVQRRKERLIDGIYEPLLGEFGAIKYEIEDGRRMPELDDLDETRKGAMYFALSIVHDEVKKKVDSVYLKLKDYQTRYKASGGILNKIIEEEVEKIRPQLEDPEKYRDRPYDVNYRAFIVGQHVGDASLRECLRIGKAPLQFLRETKPTVKDSDIDCLVSGYLVERRLVDPMAESALKRADGDPAVQETRSQRESLLAELQKLIELLTKEVLG